MKTVFLFVLILSFANDMIFAENTAARRFGIFVGANNGGKERVDLKYAVLDASTIANIFTQLGGISKKDMHLLIEPDKAEIVRIITAIAKEAGASASQRTEFVFYYSGHSDETGLLLGRTRFSYKELRDEINNVQSDMRIVILDSCSSGAFTRVKGGTKSPLFLLDDSAAASGYAFLTSSSASEVSQESDTIRSSYFTHAIAAGLRGAADTKGDGRVTLNQLYRFAYDETLFKTETSRFGAQHPNFDISISGSGDVVLTNVKETSAGLIIDQEVRGRILIRDSEGFLTAEFTKNAAGPLELGLEAGVYMLTLRQGNAYSVSSITIAKEARITVKAADFKSISTQEAQSRGDIAFLEQGENDLDNMPVDPINIQFVPFFSKAKTTNHFLLGIFAAHGYNLSGAGISTIGLSNSGYVRGFTASGIYNVASDILMGVQIAGVFNAAGSDSRGLQMGGIFNIAADNMSGVQIAGVFNLAGKDSRVVQTAGLINVAKSNFSGVQIAGLINYCGSDQNNIDHNDHTIENDTDTDTETETENKIPVKKHPVQIGIINISDNSNTLPFGIINIIKDGFISPAVYYDDTQFLNVSLKSGTKHFYGLLSIGVPLQIFLNQNDDTTLIYRLGLGAEFTIAKMFFDYDISSGTILKWYKDGNFSSSTVIQNRITAGFRFLQHLGVFVGASYDIFVPHNSIETIPARFGFFVGVHF